MKLDASNLKINSQQAESIKRNFDSRRAIKNYQKNGIVIDKRYYAQTQAIIYKGEEQFPRASQVWGIVAPPERETRKSPSAQTYTIHDDAESASVQSRNNWYDVGHVMGLNLGGSDDARNYILQAPDTNETGPWRAMERAVNQKAKELLREKEPGVIYFGVTVVYTENPKNVYELYIPTALNVYLYQIPYAEYQKLAIEELLPSESYNSLDKYIPIPLQDANKGDCRI